MLGFAGFPKEALTFFRGLAKNNNRDWFEARKQTFEDKVKAPMVDLVTALNGELAKIAPDHVADTHGLLLCDARLETHSYHHVGSELQDDHRV